MSDIIRSAARANWPTYDEASAATQEAMHSSIRGAVAAALRCMANEARWMEYPASQDPRQWAKWLENRAIEVES